jgi:EmrB/QacA subfamily drug resistance transporter
VATAGLPQRRKAMVLGAMCFSLFMAMLDNTVVNVALPRMQTDLHATVSDLQWVVDGYTLLFASFMLSGGTLGDIFGRKRAFLAGLLIFCMGSAASAAAPTAGVLIMARAVQGFGAALLMPGTLSIIANTFPGDAERARAIGLWAGISGLALAGGPIVGGLLVDNFGWQSVFLVNLPIGAVALVIAALVVPESSDPQGRRLDVPGQLLAILGLGALTYALIEGNNRGWRSPTMLGLLIGATLLLAVFLLVERRTRSPMLQLAPFRDRTFAAANGVAWLISFGMFGMFFFLSLVLQQVQGATPLQAGLMSLPATMTIAVTAPFAGRIAARRGSRLPMALGMLLAGSGLLLLVRLGPDTHFPDFWWSLPFVGLGMGLVMAPMTAAVMSTVPRQRAGMASATTSTSREMGGVFGIALLGGVVTHQYAVELGDRLSALHLPQRVQDGIIAATQSGPGSLAQAPRGVDVAAIHRMVDESFVDAVHVALVIAALAVIAGALVSVLFVRGRGRNPAAQEARRDSASTARRRRPHQDIPASAAPASRMAPPGAGRPDVLGREAIPAAADSGSSGEPPRAAAAAATPVAVPSSQPRRPEGRRAVPGSCVGRSTGGAGGT